MGTKTAPSAAELAAEAERRATELRARADQEAAEARERAEQERRRRNEVAAEWWDQRQASFKERSRGVVDAAWKRFAESVRTGEGNAAHLFAEYRRAVTMVDDDRRTIQRRTYGRAKARWDEIVAEVQAVQDRAATLIHGSRPGPDLAEYNAMLSKALGETVPPDTPVADTLDRLPGLIPPSPRAPSPTPPRVGVGSFAEAVDRVVAEVERETVEAAKADRHREREAFIDARLS